MTTIRVLIADDHKLVCAGLRLLLESFGGVHVVAEAHDGNEALVLIRRHRPDLVLMDIAMKGSTNGLEATAQLKREFPEIRAVILSMYSSEEHVLQALRAGASGYLLKNSATEELEQAVRIVMRDEIYLSRPISSRVIRDYINRVAQGQAADLLTHRQLETLRLIAEGRSTKEIACQFQLSTKTIETYRAQLMERLNIHDIAGLVRYAIRMGLVNLE